ncbi:MAG: hypothetical protein GXO47_07615 [Chlorobi bacterium]|nr:hypothetical protein [Chlorobiota bacterium]
MEEITGIDVLIVKKLTSSLTREEEKKLDKFLNESEENRKYAESLTEIWGLTGEDSLFNKINPQEDWSIVRTRMGFSKKAKKVRLISGFSKVAAVLIPFIITLSLVAYFYIPGFGRLTAYRAERNIEKIELPDGTDVTMKKGSKLIVVRKLKGKARKVKFSGEGYFEIAKDREHPFIITIAKAKVEVVGTAFNLENEGETVRVYVTKGVVRFSGDNEEILVHKGEEAVFDGNRIIRTDIKDDNFIAWKTGFLNFKDAGLEEILKVVTDSYDQVHGYKISANDQELSKIRITTTFNNQPIDEVVEELKIHFNKKIVLTNGILIISD